MSIVNKIKELCHNHGTTLAALERQLGLSKASISKWDTNSPSINKVKLVANYFNTTTDYLIFGIDKNTLGGRIRRLRLSKELFQKDLAKVVNKTSQRINAYENNYSKPDEETLQKIANYLNVPVEYLLTGEGEENITFEEPTIYFENEVDKNLPKAYTLLKEKSNKLNNKQKEDLTQLIKWYLDKELK